MAEGDTDPSGGTAARVTAVVAIVVAVLVSGASVGTAIYTSRVHARTPQPGFDPTNRFREYARFNDAERDLQQVSDAYAAVVSSVVPVDFPRIDKLYEQSEASYTAVDKALNGIRAVGSADMTGIAERLCAAERRRLDALSVDPRGGVMVGLPGDGSPEERPSERYERVEKDVDQSYDQFVRQAGRELTAR